MRSRLKEDERNDKAIRSLLRKPPNRTCINCNSLGPQDVCLNFWTFVCTQCSGIHRAFAHQVKSVSMSKFTSQEVANLQSGGNERGKEIYFKDWDSQRQPLPDSSNVDRLREFIKMVYVDKRFLGDKPLSQPRLGDWEESYDSHGTEPHPNYRADSHPNYRADSRSPSYEDRYDEWPSGGWRSNAGYDGRHFDEGGRFDERRSPERFESDQNMYDKNCNDAQQYDDRPHYETGDRQQYEDGHNEGLNRRFERASRNNGGNSPPSVCPVSEILGENVLLRVENQGIRTNGGRDLQDNQKDGRQRFGYSSSFGSVDGNVAAAAPVVKREDSTSSIYFSAEPKPPPVREQPDLCGLNAAVQPLALNAAAVQPSADASNSTGLATFGPATPTTLAETFVQPSTGAPAPSVSGGFTNSASHINGNSQWAAQWAPTSLPPAVDPNANSWSALVGPSVHVGTSQKFSLVSQPWNAFSASSRQAKAHLVQQTAKLHDLQSASSTAGAASHVTTAQPSGRQEIPEVNMADRSTEAVFDELVMILTADYACLAFNLPNGSKTIWSIVEQDMEEHSLKEPFADDQIEILRFLSNFFAEEFVECVASNLKILAQSSLGVEFTLRRPKADFGKAVIEGLREDAFEMGSAIGTFLGITPELEEHKDADDELYGHHHTRETTAAHEFGRQEERGGRSAGRDKGEARTTRGVGSEGKEEGDGEDDPAANPRLNVMDEAITRWVQLSAYKTPPRNKPGRNIELKDRSKEFTKVVGHRSGLLYSPLHSVRGIVSLYHGTRSSSLESFVYLGIDPKYTTNEFSRREAFYLTNSIQYAYEFPLHYHPSRNVADPVAVLEFKVKAEILHGEQPPSPESSCFSVKWFHGPDDAWRKFCLVNMLPQNAAMRLGLNIKHHSYDIVIGPICKNVSLTGEVGVVGIDLPNNVYLTQVALCTDRARTWLEENLRFVYREVRRPEI